MEPEAATLLTLRIPAFAAAIRKAADPGLGTRPVVVATSFKPLGRVLAVCPEARSAGIAEEMHYPAARTLCPGAAFFVPDRELAAHVVRELIQEALAYSPLVEAAGDGRIVLDTQGTERLWGEARRVAERLREAVRERLRLPAAAGLASRRPWSLLASRAAGEDGICLVEPGAEGDFLDRVPPSWLDGITPRTRARLMELNIGFLGQLRRFTREELFRQFTPGCGEALWRALHPPPWDGVAAAAGPGVAEAAVRVEAVFDEASVAEERLRAAARALAAEAAAALRARGLGAARLRLTLLHTDGAVKSAVARTGGFIQDEETLVEMAFGLLGRIFRRRVRALRLWLAAEKLAPPERQGVLFAAGPDAADRREKARLLAALDGIHRRFGDAALRRGDWAS